VIDVNAQIMAALMVLLLLASYAGAEGYVRAARARDAARIRAARARTGGARASSSPTTVSDIMPELPLASFPTASGPCR
jgi:hypothetical protein